MKGEGHRAARSTSRCTTPITVTSAPAPLMVRTQPTSCCCSGELTEPQHLPPPPSFPDEKCRGQPELDGSSRSSSSGDSMSGPSRLVPGHRLWANRNGRHILGLIEDYSALRKQISDGRKLSRSLITQLQECVAAFRHSSSNKVLVIVGSLSLSLSNEN